MKVSNAKVWVFAFNFISLSIHVIAQKALSVCFSLCNHFHSPSTQFDLSTSIQVDEIIYLTKNTAHKHGIGPTPHVYLIKVTCWWFLFVWHCCFHCYSQSRWFCFSDFLFDLLLEFKLLLLFKCFSFLLLFPLKKSKNFEGVSLCIIWREVGVIQKLAIKIHNTLQRI